jgi:hypothetical protein
MANGTSQKIDRPDSPPAKATASRPGTEAIRRRSTLASRLRRDYPVLLLALPGMVIILAFQYYPLYGNIIAFQDFQPHLGVGRSLWNGVENFAVIINGDPEFLNASKTISATRERQPSALPDRCRERGAVAGFVHGADQGVS